MSLVDKLNLKKNRSKLLINSMLIVGYFPYDLPKFDIRKYAWPVTTVSFLVYIFTFTLYNLNYLHGFAAVISIAKSTLSAVMCLTIILITFKKRRNLIYLVDRIENNFYTYSDEENFKFVSSTSNLSEKISIYAIATFLLIVHAVAGLTTPIYVTLHPDLIKNGSSIPTISPTWVPFKGDTFFSFYMKHAAVHILTSSAFANLIGNLWLTMTVQMELSYQFERLTYALKTIAERVQIQIDKKNSNTLQVLSTIAAQDRKSFENSDCLPFTAEFNEIYEAKLVECVKHYQKIVEAYKTFQSWFGLIFGITLAHSVLTLAMMSYGALMTIGDFGTSVKYMILFFGYLVQFYIYCNCGENVFRMNEDFSNEIYNLEWYRQPASRRKLFYNVFLCDSQKPLRMHGLFIYPASLTIFSSVVKLTYSYLNLLRTYGSSTSSNI